MRPVSADRGALGQPYRRLFAGSVVSKLGDGIGTVAYPWLATAITRDPLLIALVAVAQRLPWLVFSLPAGVITDRYDRRLLMVSANLVRATVALVVGAVVLAAQGTLPALDALGDADTVIETRVGLYLVLVAATLVFGVAEVLHEIALEGRLRVARPHASQDLADAHRAHVRPRVRNELLDRRHQRRRREELVDGPR